VLYLQNYRILSNFIQNIFNEQLKISNLFNEGVPERWKIGVIPVGEFVVHRQRCVLVKYKNICVYFFQIFYWTKETVNLKDVLVK
jgi:hypothetical protein